MKSNLKVLMSLLGGAVLSLSLMCSPASAVDNSIANYLKQHKITTRMINGLAVVANQNGYWVPSNFKKNFAAINVGTCLDIRSGLFTWSEQIQDDMSGGASRRQARNFNAYLKNSFCPKVR